MKENDNLEKNIALCKEIEGMVYKVYIHFDESAKEDMKDKIKKLLIKEISWSAARIDQKSGDVISYI